MSEIHTHLHTCVVGIIVVILYIEMQKPANKRVLLETAQRNVKFIIDMMHGLLIATGLSKQVSGTWKQLCRKLNT